MPEAVPMCGLETSWYKDGTGMEEKRAALPPPAHSGPEVKSLEILNLNPAFLYHWEGRRMEHR